MDDDEIVVPWEKQLKQKIERMSKISSIETAPMIKRFSNADTTAESNTIHVNNDQEISCNATKSKPVGKGLGKKNNILAYSRRILSSPINYNETAQIDSAFYQNFKQAKSINLSEPLDFHIDILNPPRCISQEEAVHIDEELFTEYSFSVDQLMELAGLSCAAAIETAYPISSLNCPDPGVLVCCGPGNNGGDGLVCARHLQLFGYKPTVYYPRAPKKQLYINLVKQCEKMGISFLSYIPSETKILESSYSLIVDALFGFGFRPPLSPDFSELIQRLSSLQLPLISIDVPSGWEISEQTTTKDILQPDCLISLTAPKQCASRFNGRFHFLGGRFIPSSLADKYELNLPLFSGSSCFAVLSCPKKDI